MKPLEERVKEFMKQADFILVDEEPVCWYENKVTPRRRLGFTNDQATYMYRQSLEARRDELTSWKSAYQTTTNIESDPFIDAMASHINELGKFLEEV